MNTQRWHQHAMINRLQTLLLLSVMAGFLALLGWLLLGADGVVILLITGSALLLFNPTARPALIMRLYQAHALNPAQAPILYEALQQLARAAQLPESPTLYYLPSPVINAFAVGSPQNAAIAVSDGLLRTLDRRETVAVLAHELSHIKNNDIRVMAIADLFSRLTSMLSLFGQALLLIYLPLVLFMDAPINIPALLVLILAPTLSALAQLGLSRVREYGADLNAALLTGDPHGLASALRKIEQRQGAFFERVFLPGRRLPEPSLLRTHPPSEERIRRLLALTLRHETSQHHQHHRHITGPWH